MAQTPVLFIHDAAIDEYMASVLLTTMPGVDLRGIIIVNADCVAGPAMNTGWKIQSFIGRLDIPLALSRARGLNPFPWPYRADCIGEGTIPLLAAIPVNPDWPWYPASEDSTVQLDPGIRPGRQPLEAVGGYPSGDRLLADLLGQAARLGNPITLLINSPVTPLADVLRADPSLAAGIGELIWMGGAVDGIPGNLDPATIPAVVANGYAEWNAFWDPFAVDWLLRNTAFPITLFPLNVTNQAKLTPAFLQQLANQSSQYAYSNLAYQSYQLVAKETFYDLWDVLATCYVGRPDLFSPPRPTKLSIVTEGYFQGALYADEDAPRSVNVILDLADPAGFYDYVLTQFAR